MKIALCADAFPPHFSGISTYSVELTRQLINKGHQVLIFAPDTGEENVVPHGLEKAKIIRLRSFKAPKNIAFIRFCYPNTRKIINELRNFKPDIIETQSPSFLGMDGLIASKVLNIPCVSVFHTMTTSKEYIKIVFKDGGENFEKMSWMFHRRYYNQCNLVHVGTDKMYKLLVKNRIKKNLIKKIPMLFDFYSIKILSTKQKDVLKEFYNLKKNVAVYFGRISKEKNLDTLINIWSNVVRKNNDSTLLIIGDGPYLKNLKAQVGKSGLNDNICFLGYIDHERLLTSGLLSICDLFVSTSTTETFGLTSVEAMASKLPAVLFKSQGAPEIVADGGFVINPKESKAFEDVILKIFADPKLRYDMGEKARKIASQYDSTTVVDKIIANYAQAIKTFKPGRFPFSKFMDKFRSKLHIRNYRDLFTLH